MIKKMTNSKWKRERERELENNASETDRQTNFQERHVRSKCRRQREVKLARGE